MKSHYVKYFVNAILLALLSFSQAVIAKDPALGPGDVVRISVYGQQDLNTITRITSEGRLSFPLIGEVNVAGKSNREAESEIAALLQRGNFVRNPQVQIFVEERRTNPEDLVTILGEIEDPGKFPVQSVSGEGAGTIVDLLALAGGVTRQAADYLTLVTTKDGITKRVQIDLIALVKDADIRQNYTISGGDLVLIPKADFYYIYGEVKRPGRYRLERDTSVMQALSVSGGLTEDGREKGITLRRRDKSGESKEFKVKTTEQLQADDVVHVKSRLF